MKSPHDRSSESAGNCSNSPGGCQIGELFDLLSKAHMLDLLHIFTREVDGPLRFVDIQTRLNISPNTLASRLKALVAAGLLTRTAYNEIPPRVDYEVTAKALDLRVVFKALADWAQRNALTPDSPVDATAKA